MLASCCWSAPCSGEVMTAPMNAALSCVTALRAARTVEAGCASVEDLISSTLCPSTPPLALASSAANCHASVASLPNCASAPEDGGISATRSGSLSPVPSAPPPPPSSSPPHAARPPIRANAATAANTLRFTSTPLLRPQRTHFAESVDRRVADLGPPRRGSCPPFGAHGVYSARSTSRPAGTSGNRRLVAEVGRLLRRPSSAAGAERRELGVALLV